MKLVQDSYILLGTEQKSVALMFFIEMLIIGIASIVLGLLGYIVGAALSFTLTLLMSQWTLGFLDYRVPYDIIINNNYSIISDTSAISKISDLPKMDYKKIIEHLNNNEVTMQWAKLIEYTDIENYIKENSTINIDGNNLKINSNSYYKESIGEGIYNINTNDLVVLPDEWCKKLILASTDFFANTKEKISYDKALSLEKQYVPQWFEENYSKVLSEYNKDNKDKSHAWYPIFTRVKVAEVS